MYLNHICCLRALVMIFFSLCTVSLSAQETVIPKEFPELDSIQQKQNPEDKGTVEDLLLEVDGLMIDETRTKAGRDFYNILYNMWEAPAGATNYMIRIIEKPFRINTTQIEIWVNDDAIGSAMLEPRNELIEELAVNVNKALLEYLVNFKQMSEQLQDVDQAGTGLF